jgi:hypothetical protein
MVGRAGFDSLQKLGFFLFATASRPTLGPTQLPVMGTQGIKSPGRVAESSAPSSAEFKNVWSYTTIPTCLHGVVII